MRFEPKIIRARDPDPGDAVELELPDDLAVLGDQLRDDAALLAERYPAQETTAAAPVRDDLSPGALGHVRRWRLPMAVAASIALLAAFWWVTGPWTRPSGPSDRVTARTEHSDRQASATSSPAGAPSDSRPAPRVMPAPTDPRMAPGRSFGVPDASHPGASRMPGAFLLEVTGPELEGVLDLLEQKVGRECDLSI